MKPYLLLVALAVPLLTLTACSKRGTDAEDHSNPYFAQAEKFAGEGNVSGAVAEYEKALQVNPAVAKAYKKLGDLHGEKLADPAGAIYFYQKYLKARPNAADREAVTASLDKAKRDFASTLPPPTPVNGEDFARLNPATQNGSGFNLTVNVPAANGTAAQGHFTPVTNSGKNYTVQKGDTLWKIATKFFRGNVKGGIEKIKQANPETANNDKGLKPGTTLVIP